MRLRLKSLAELGDLPEHIRKQIEGQLAGPKASKVPTVGTFQDLIAQAKSLRLDLRQANKRVREAKSYKTAIQWRLGKVLTKIKAACKHGQWLPTLALIGVSDQRASEYIRIAALYPSEGEAKKHRVRQALDAIPKTRKRKSNRKPAGQSEPDPQEIITNVVIGNSADLIARVARLYLPPPGSSIADVTAGRLVFWRKIDLSQYNFAPSDLYTGKEATEIAPYDCRHLPYKDNSFDLGVLDLPFGAMPYYEEEYKTATTNLTQPEVRRLYREAMNEADRIVRPGGLSWVKCQDICKNGRQWRNTIYVWQIARKLGWIDEDDFKLIATRHHGANTHNKTQRHARKACSVLWVFRKPKNPKSR